MFHKTLIQYMSNHEERVEFLHTNSLINFYSTRYSLRLCGISVQHRILPMRKECNILNNALRRRDYDKFPFSTVAINVKYLLHNMLAETVLLKY